MADGPVLLTRLAVRLADTRTRRVVYPSTERAVDTAGVYQNVKFALAAAAPNYVLDQKINRYCLLETSAPVELLIQQSGGSLQTIQCTGLFLITGSVYRLEVKRPSSTASETTINADLYYS